MITPAIDGTPLWNKSTLQCRLSGDYHADSVTMMYKGDIAIVLESSYSSECGWWEYRVLFGESIGWVIDGHVNCVRK